MPAFFKTLEKLRPIYEWTYKILLFLCKLLLIGDILITSFAVAGRYISFIPDPTWSEQMVLTFMVYMAVISAALAIRRGAHIRMTAFDNMLPKKVVLTLDVLADIAVMVLGVLLLIEGTKVCTSPLAKFGKYESIPTLSRVWMYLPMPIAGGSMIIFELEQLFQHIEAFFVKDEEKEATSK